MTIVITNGKYYIGLNEEGKHRKYEDINKAFIFQTIGQAVEYMKSAPRKTKNYYVYDVLTGKVIYKRFTSQEEVEAYEAQRNIGEIVRDKNGNIKRKKYSPTARKMLYEKYEGKCQLCGRQLTINDSTLDHIIPLSKGGVDDNSNIWITCLPCNKFKDNLLPEDYGDRITKSFLYQAERKCKSKIKWRLLSALVGSM